VDLMNDGATTTAASPARAIVLPGGGYVTYGSLESEPVAEWLTGIGLPSSVFRYPINARHPAPLMAIRAEVARVRSSGVDRVGLVGFSAGGHAAAHAALAPGARADERVDFVVLGYPVVSMWLRDRVSVTPDTLLGSNAADELRDETSADLLVTAAAPPFFVWHTAADEIIGVEHSYRLCASLARAGVPHELHVFEAGHHGLALAADEPGAAAWPALCRSWLTRIGALEAPADNGQIR
jgi:acetyl esterase/lipase